MPEFNLPYQYAYFTACLILFVFWLLIFLKRKDLRREMLWASFFGAPFGLIDYFLVPQYWNPESLFGLIKKYGLGIESFLFLFLMAGIASVAYEFLEKEGTKKMAGRRKPHWFPLALAVCSFLALVAIFPEKAVYNFMAAGVIGAIATIYLRQDLLRQIVASAFIFSLFYFIVFLLVNQIFSGWINNFYNLKNTWGILVFGVPLEEILVAFFTGAFWSASYECVKSYREKKL